MSESQAARSPPTLTFCPRMAAREPRSVMRIRDHRTVDRAYRFWRPARLNLRVYVLWNPSLSYADAKCLVGGRYLSPDRRRIGTATAHAYRVRKILPEHLSRSVTRMDRSESQRLQQFARSAQPAESDDLNAVARTGRSSTVCWSGGAWTPGDRQLPQYRLLAMEPRRCRPGG